MGLGRLGRLSSTRQSAAAVIPALLAAVAAVGCSRPRAPAHRALLIGLSVAGLLPRRSPGEKAGFEGTRLLGPGPARRARGHVARGLPCARRAAPRAGRCRHRRRGAKERHAPPCALSEPRHEPVARTARHTRAGTRALGGLDVVVGGQGAAAGAAGGRGAAGDGHGHRGRGRLLPPPPLRLPPVPPAPRWARTSRLAAPAGALSPRGGGRVERGVTAGGATVVSRPAWSRGGRWRPVRVERRGGGGAGRGGGGTQVDGGCLVRGRAASGCAIGLGCVPWCGAGTRRGRGAAARDAEAAGASLLLVRRLPTLPLPRGQGQDTDKQLKRGARRVCVCAREGFEGRRCPVSVSG